jgi:hypothetical protein
MTAQQDSQQPRPAPSPLEAAREWARRVHQIADYWTEQERTDKTARLRADIAGAGRDQYEAGQMAAFMALVSLAEDVHRIAEVLAGPPGDGQTPPLWPDP